MKKKLTLTLVAQVEIDTDWYPDPSDECIIETEKKNWAEWITGADLLKEEIVIEQPPEVESKYDQLIAHKINAAKFMK